eukprot:scaffold415293_cov35-Attheya_sp.AAC.1
MFFVSHFANSTTFFHQSHHANRLPVFGYSVLGTGIRAMRGLCSVIWIHCGTEGVTVDVILYLERLINSGLGLIEQIVFDPTPRII